MVIGKFDKNFRRYIQFPSFVIAVNALTAGKYLTQTASSAREITVANYDGSSRQIWNLQNTVSFNANGGSGAPSMQLKNYGSSLTLPSTKPTKRAAHFLGWSTSSSATSASYSAGGSYSGNGNVTLYAVWGNGCESNAHNYYSSVTQPTCTAQGYTTYRCTICGYSYNGAYTNAKNHSYKSVVTAPTCTAQGYTTYTCTACSHSYKDTYTAVKAHSYVQGVCSGCGAKDPNFNATKVTLESKTARAGDTVTLNVKLEKKLNVKSIGINNISFDSTKLELVSGEWLLKGTTIADFNVTSKSAAATFTANTAIEGSVLKLTFKVKDGVAEGDIAISFNVQAKQVNNGNEEAIALQAVSGKITVVKVMKGDVDGNNKVDSDDAIYLLYNTLFGSGDYPLNQTTDFDGNGKTDSDDAIHLLYHTLFGASDYPLK